MIIRLKTDLSWGGRIHYQDKEYDLPDNLARQLLAAGQAEPVQQPAPPKQQNMRKAKHG